MTYLEIVIALGLGLIGVLPGILAFIMQLRNRQRADRNTEADTDEKTAEAVESYAQAAKTVSEQYQVLLTRAEAQETVIKKLRDEIQAAVNQMTEYEKKLEKVRTIQCNLEIALEEAYERIEYLQQVISGLTSQIVTLGQTPCVTPEEWKPSISPPTRPYKKENDDRPQTKPNP